jgi:hypothetical protein
MFKVCFYLIYIFDVFVSGLEPLFNPSQLLSSAVSSDFLDGNSVAKDQAKDIPKGEKVIMICYCE